MTNIISFEENFLSPESCSKLLESLGHLDELVHKEKHLDRLVPRSKRIQFTSNAVTSTGIPTHAPINRDWFIQSSKVNDFHGTRKRVYTNFEPDFRKCQVFKRVLDHHHKVFNIPEDTVTLSILQKSFYTPENLKNCPTGQGIHSDGVQFQTIVVLEKENLIGPENSFYLPRLDDSSVIKEELCRKELEIGDLVHFHDNLCYHSVSRSKLKDKSQNGSRTVLILSSPAHYHFTGESNPNNLLVASPKF